VCRRWSFDFLKAFIYALSTTNTLSRAVEAVERPAGNHVPDPVRMWYDNQCRVARKSRRPILEPFMPIRASNFCNKTSAIIL
jgi:hypothetical protein